MNDNILCLYYSRTGNTKKAMQEIAEALDCECLEIRDKVDRSGTLGYLRCCFDAMHKRTSAVSRPNCRKPLSDYKLVILGTPVWAGRCSSVIRGFLKRRGYEIQNAAYVITHKSEQDYKDVFRERDVNLQTPPVAGFSCCPHPAACPGTWRRSRSAPIPRAITSGATSSSRAAQTIWRGRTHNVGKAQTARAAL